MKKRLFNHFVTTVLLLGTGLAALTVLSSCENFLKGGQIKNEIEETIAYNNAPSVTVYLKSDAKFGEFLSDGEKSFKVGYDTLVQFSVNTDSYVFDKLEAVVRTSPETSRNEYVQFTPVESDTKKGIYKINVKVLEQKNDIMIRPVCKPLPKIGTITPSLEVNGCNQDSEIIIPFNKEMAPASFKDATGKIKGISITTPDGEDLSEYFGEPFFDSANKSLHILPLCLVDDTKYLLPPDGTKNALNIEISYTFINVKDEDGFEFTANGTHSYKINKNFSEQENIVVIVQNPTTGNGSFLSSGEKNCIVRFGFDIEFTLNKEEYIFQGFEAVSQNNVLDESYVSFENRQYDDETGIYKAKVRVIQAADDIIIRPKCQLITNTGITINGKKGAKSITPANGTVVTSFINHNYSISFNPDDDYEFVKWELYDINTDDAIPNGTYVTITDPTLAETNYKVIQVPADTIKLGLRAVVAERPQLISNTPQNGGILKDSTIQVLFDHDMDPYSIYYTDNEIDELIALGVNKDEFLPEIPASLQNNYGEHYGYTKNGKTYFKNISLSNNKTGININDKFEAPFFENARTLSIPASKEEESSLDDYTQVLVTIEKGFFYSEPLDAVKTKPITLRGSKKWMYQVTNHGDEDSLVFQRKSGNDLVSIKLENTQSSATLTSASVHPTISEDGTGISTLKFLKIKNEKPTLYCDIELQDVTGGSGPNSTFAVYYERIKEADYLTPGQGEKVTGSFGCEYTATTSQDAILKGDLVLDLPVDGLYRIWFDFTDRSNNHFYYPAHANEENSNVGFYLVKDTGVYMAAPIVTDTSDENDIKLNLNWTPCIDFVKTKIRYKKKTESDWSAYEEFTGDTQKEYDSLVLNTDYDFEIINTDLVGNTQTVNLTPKTADLNITISGTPEKTLYFTGEEFDKTGLTMTASLTTGVSWDVSENHNFSSTEICWQGKTIAVSVNLGEVTKSANINATYYVAKSDALTNSPIKLTNYSGSLSGGIYYKFGDYPQTIKASSVNVSEKTVYKDWYLGDDGYFYEKCLENGYSNNDKYSDKYSDGTIISQLDANSTKYFKVEPIKWRMIETSTGYKIFLAENVLTANIPYYLDQSNRTINGTKVYPNNYKYSTVRAWLNGSYESGDTQIKTYEGKGFLQKAFSGTAQDIILDSYTVNDAVSTNPSGWKWNNGENRYASDERTKNKIFLFSQQEVTYTGYGFAKYTIEGLDSASIRRATDYAKANYAAQSTTDGEGCTWRLRSPSYGDWEKAYCVTSQGETFLSIKVYANLSAGIVPALFLEKSYSLE